MAETKLLFLYNQDHVIHRPIGSSPENPERVLKTLRYLKNKKSSFSGKVEFSSLFSPAEEKDLLLIHQKEYVDFIKTYCARGGGFLGDSTYFTPGTYSAAANAVGGAIEAVDAVATGRKSYAYSFMRPPGHHAKADSYGGFCVFNNVAVAVRKAQTQEKIKKAMIVDWDAHAANGTMRIFYNDPTVLLVSLHRDPKDFYPGEGFAHQIGSGKGRGTTVNIELPPGAGDEEYMLILEEMIKPLYHEYSPDLLIGCVGYDAHFSEQMPQLSMTTQGFYNFTHRLKDLTGYKMALIFEGGYNLYNPRITHSIINALVDDPIPYTEEMDLLSSSLVRTKKVNKLVRDRIRQLKHLLSDFYTF